jgi:hypothetical protein
MLNPGQPSYIRYGISHPVLLAVLALRLRFASVDSDLLCALAAESWRRNYLNLEKGSLLKTTLELTRGLRN